MKGWPNDVHDAAVVIPVKAFSAAKLRLAAQLDQTERRSLARRLADRVVSVAGQLPVAIVCDDDEVAAWATGRGAAGSVVSRTWPKRVGSRGGGSAGDKASPAHCCPRRSALRDRSAPAARCAHPLAPDRRRDGTNVICLPAGCGFRFSYGAGSFRRHLAEACRISPRVRIVADPQLSFDVDTPEDLAELLAAAETSAPLDR